ncbi:MAG: hypothetical protein KBS95_06600 [Alistipes sp.]|nr:hypothetical protein [Candidatus Alistipes equi]
MKINKRFYYQSPTVDIHCYVTEKGFFMSDPSNIESTEELNELVEQGM